MGWIECHGGHHSKQSIFFRLTKEWLAASGQCFDMYPFTGNHWVTSPVGVPPRPLGKCIPRGGSFATKMTRDLTMKNDSISKLLRFINIYQVLYCIGFNQDKYMTQWIMGIDGILCGILWQLNMLLEFAQKWVKPKVRCPIHIHVGSSWDRWR